MPAAVIIPFPPRRTADQDRLNTALQDLQAALHEQQQAMHEWRLAMTELGIGVAGLGLALGAYQDALGGVGTKINALRDDTRQLEAWADGVLNSAAL